MSKNEITLYNFISTTLVMLHIYIYTLTIITKLSRSPNWLKSTLFSACKDILRKLITFWICAKKTSASDNRTYHFVRMRTCGTCSLQLCLVPVKTFWGNLSHSEYVRRKHPLQRIVHTTSCAWERVAPVHFRESCTPQGRIQGFRKGGEQKKLEVTVHVVVTSTGRRPVDATPRASPGWWFGGGCPPSRIRNKLK